MLTEGKAVGARSGQMARIGELLAAEPISDCLKYYRKFGRQVPLSSAFTAGAGPLVLVVQWHYYHPTALLAQSNSRIIISYSCVVRLPVQRAFLLFFMER